MSSANKLSQGGDSPWQQDQVLQSRASQAKPEVSSDANEVASPVDVLESASQSGRVTARGDASSASSISIATAVLPKSPETQSRAHGGYFALRTALADQDITLRCKEIGRGDPDAAQWVVLAARPGVSEMFWRALEHEVGTLTKLQSAGVAIPNLGPGSSDSIIFPLKLGQDAAKAFIEERVHDGVEMEKHAAWDFGRKIADELAKKEKALDGPLSSTARSDLMVLQRYLSEHTISDFQVIYAKQSGHIFVIDPGDSTISSSGSQPKECVDRWLKLLEPRRKRS